jgi:hypothetical protein
VPRTPIQRVNDLIFGHAARSPLQLVHRVHEARRTRTGPRRRAAYRAVCPGLRRLCIHRLRYQFGRVGNGEGAEVGAVYRGQAELH